MTERPSPSADVPAVGARAPDFFIVGHPKSGTTALYRMLRSHPQIYMPALKEPLFFASDMRPSLQRGAKPRFPATYEEYLTLFAAAAPDQRAGEATPSYLRSHVAAEAIAQAQPAARIIAIFREPASFVRSLHLQRRQEHVESEPELARALALEERRRQERLKVDPRDRPLMLLYSEFVRYVEQLRRYHAVFPREQVMALIYDDFRRDNDATVRSVLRFLDVDDTVPIHTTEANPTVAVRSHRLERLIRGAQSGRGPLSRPAHALLTTLTPQDLRRKLFYPLRKRIIYRNPQPTDEHVMNDVRRRFKGEVEALSQYLDRDLITLWGYDSLD